MSTNVFEKDFNKFLPYHSSIYDILKSTFVTQGEKYKKLFEQENPHLDFNSLCNVLDCTITSCKDLLIDLKFAQYKLEQEQELNKIN